MKTTIIDTNILLRYILKDHKTESPQANNLFLKAQQKKINIIIPQAVIFELTAVLRNYYKYPKTEMLEFILPILSRPWLQIESKTLFLETCDYYKSHGIDFVDAFLLAQSKKTKIPLTTFDRKLNRISKDLQTFKNLTL